MNNEISNLAYDSYLAHHGVKGQKWGVRRYQNPDGSLTDAGRRREARDYQRRLNKLDKESAKNISKYIESDYKSKEYTHRANEASSNKALRYKSKSDKYKKDSEKYKKAYENLDSETWKLVGEIASTEYDVLGTKKIRTVMAGKDYALQALAGPMGYVTIKSLANKKYDLKYPANYYGIQVNQNPNNVVGMDWKVRSK